ncbi:MAG: DUF3667 domain-containing protein [Erythrobacter sp.]
MSDFGEGLGTAIEGGLLGRTLDREKADAAGHAHAGPVTCANCQTVFTGNFCPECGQKAHIHRSLAAIGHDIMHGVLHLDGKLWATLPLLTFKPGQLTRRYIAGERAKFVSPMAMFLFTVFAMFAVFQMVGISAPTDFAEGMYDGFTDGKSSSSVVRTELQQQITDLQKERDGLAKADPRRAQIENELTGLTKVLDAQPKGAIEIDTSDIDAGGTGIKFLDEGIIKKWQKNPSLMLYKLQSNGYKFSWLLIPLSLPFLWLIFAWRRQYKAYDHAIFITYSLSFMSLLFIVMSILSTIEGGGDYAALLFVIAAPLHLYKQLRHAYSLSRFSAFWRWGVLLFCTQTVLILFLQVLLLLGAF